jgi:hypothetical protein
MVEVILLTLPKRQLRKKAVPYLAPTELSRVMRQRKPFRKKPFRKKAKYSALKEAEANLLRPAMHPMHLVQQQ